MAPLPVNRIHLLSSLSGGRARQKITMSSSAAENFQSDVEASSAQFT